MSFSSSLLLSAGLAAKLWPLLHQRITKSVRTVRGSSSESVIPVIVIVAIFGYAWLSHDSSGGADNADSSTFLTPTSLTRDEAIENHWDEIREHLNRTGEIEACSLTAGNCYSLEADIVAGNIDTLYFPTGGYLQFGAEIDESGSASDVDAEGRPWDFTLDMNSAIVEDAINEWARQNGYRIE